MSRKTAPAFLALLVVLAGAPAGAANDGTYLPAVLVEGSTFPVARTDWYSVINFTDDWNAPRMRFERGKWRQTGRHEGIDIYAEPGTPIRSISGGRIENLGWTFYSGWRVGIRGDDGRYWFYAHLRRFAPGLRTGLRVEPGTTLGEVGNTGYGENPGHSNEFSFHLHFGLQERDGTWTDPYPMLRSLYRDATEAR